MITYANFKIIYDEVEQAVKDTYSAAQANEKKQNDFVCLLARADYHEIPLPGYSPYSIDDIRDLSKDKDRLDFLQEFLTFNYGFPEGRSSRDDNKFLAIELMSYTHIWESKPLYRILCRLAELSSGLDYSWKIDVPDYGKTKWLTDNIVTPFRTSVPSIHAVIEKGYHRQLRNAFAHSEFSFTWHSGHISLFNYKGKTDEIEELTFNEWTIRFCYSFLLDYFMYSYLDDTRRNVDKIYGTSVLPIQYPTSSGYITKDIVYRKDNDMFQFQ